ncbi:putative E3 ubiquitin-protein ligase BAH1 [Lupinus albus]|uniref:RING-type E3 ubiquitin transferase n=1 Tax=Lupinus albus TaxID=3870 RepID=A0A6A4QU56_LUPAL|nr:putative E3 ubiquitin-protein ligase BAH1 [Lupinus albus]
MKFCKKYQDYMLQEQENKLPGVGFKKHKKILKKCKRRDYHSHKDHTESHAVKTTHDHCPVCDGTFFPSLLNEMTAIVGCFNQRAETFLELQLASGFRKYFSWFLGKLLGNKHAAIVQEGKDIITYALINAIAIRKILKKYDKVNIMIFSLFNTDISLLSVLQIHYSKQGQLFKSQAQSLHKEILPSPWLYELLAFHVNLRETQVNSMKEPALFEGFSLTFRDGKPSITCEFFDFIKIDIDLTCSICLVTASVSIVNGLKTADHRNKCPLCREGGVYEGSVHLEELNILLGRKCKEYWEERLERERVERNIGSCSVGCSWVSKLNNQLSTSAIIQNYFYIEMKPCLVLVLFLM